MIKVLGGAHRGSRSDIQPPPPLTAAHLLHFELSLSFCLSLRPIAAPPPERGGDQPFIVILKGGVGVRC
ncbi:hypothetical protein Hanom_Chr16g01415001 [Helianthus anomalus]